jgi:hypothetical protein
MKNNKILLVTSFITGLVFGISVLGLLSFSSAPASGLSPLNQETARAFIASYAADAAPSNAIVKGFTIDRVQLDAMNALIRENSSLAGFRIYLGKNASDRKLGIVVGVDAQGRDALNNTIFGTDASSVSPCPPVCDAANVLTRP